VSLLGKEVTPEGGGGKQGLPYRELGTRGGENSAPCSKPPARIREVGSFLSQGGPGARAKVGKEERPVSTAQDAARDQKNLPPHSENPLLREKGSPRELYFRAHAPAPSRGRLVIKRRGLYQEKENGKNIVSFLRKVILPCSYTHGRRKKLTPISWDLCVHRGGLTV